MARILVVDDEWQIRHALRLTLEDAGHEVTEAADGKEVLASVRADRPDLVILDIIMPDQEGLETIQQLRRYAPHLKVIAMTGGGSYVGVEWLQIAQMLGADRTIAKPFTRQMVLEAVDDLIS